MRSPTARQVTIARLLLIIVVSVAAGIILGWSVGVIVHPWLGAIGGVALGGMLGYSLWQDLPRPRAPEVSADSISDLGRVHLCYLHEDEEPEHWCTAEEIVGVHLLDGDTIRIDLTPSPAHRECAGRLIEPERIVRHDPAGLRAGTRTATRPGHCSRCDGDILVGEWYRPGPGQRQICPGCG